MSVPTEFHSTLCRTYHTLCILVRQPITEVKAEWNVAADVREIDNMLLFYPFKSNFFFYFYPIVSFEIMMGTPDWDIGLIYIFSILSETDDRRTAYSF